MVTKDNGGSMAGRKRKKSYAPLIVFMLITIAVVMGIVYYVLKDDVYFLQEKSAWIERTLAKVKEANRAGEEAPLSLEDIRELADRALTELPSRVRYFASLMGVTYGRITIRNQTGRWGSCSSVGNLNFNCLLMLATEEVRDYVIVHELAHRKEMNHSAAFWEQVEAVLPDYREREKWLKTQGKVLLARMRSGAQL